MKTFISDLIPKLKRYSQKLDNITLLTNQHWVVIEELTNSKYVYIFRSNFELLISQNGKVEKGKWEYLGNNSLLIDRKGESFLFRHGFFDENVLALKVDGKDEYAFLVNENNYGGELNSIDKIISFLENKYLNIIPPKAIHPRNRTELTFITHQERMFEKDLNLVCNSEGKYGFVDLMGNTKIDFIYDDAHDFHEGLALVYKGGKGNNKYGFINEKGEQVVGFIYEYAVDFSDELAMVRSNRKFGFINKSGKLTIPIIYDDAESFSNGKASVEVGKRRFYIDKFGNKF